MAGERSRMQIAQLVAEHHQAVYAYAFRLSGSQPEAEDLTQHTFMVAQEKLGQLRKAERARRWLFTILRNRFVKTRQQRRPASMADLGLSIEAVPAEIPREDEIDRERLQEALDELPDMFRVVVMMFYFEEYAYREMAEHLDLPIGTVMSRLARAKGRLRHELLKPPRPESPTRQPSTTR